MADMRNSAFMSGSSKQGKTLPCQFPAPEQSIIRSYLSGVCGFQPRRCNAVLDPIRSVARLVEAFKVALELAIVGDSNLDDL